MEDEVFRMVDRLLAWKDYGRVGVIIREILNKEGERLEKIYLKRRKGIIPKYFNALNSKNAGIL